LTCERELGDECEKDGGGGWVHEEAGGEEVAAGDECVGVATFDERVEAIGGAKVLYALALDDDGVK
jgi:hypothetical protein